MWNKIITTLLILITLTTATAQSYTKKPNFKDIEATMERIMKTDGKTSYSYISHQMLNAIVSAGNSIKFGNEIGIPKELIKKIDYIKSVFSDGAPSKYFLEQILQLREKTIKECGFETIAYISTPQKSSSIYMYKGEGGLYCLVNITNKKDSAVIVLISGTFTPEEILGICNIN
ncbi:MAG: DUF4252 domain-containing protein [Bacteroidaceae bacterium]|nr:DUF4252 domain-containing protein [Bacteroidaceae bacterium]